MSLSLTPAAATYDVAIIGGGPAGVAAAISIVTEGPSVAVFDKEGPGGQVATSSRIENVFGVGVGGKTGTEIMGIGVDQARVFGTTFISPFNAVKLTKDASGLFTIVANNREHVTCRAVVLALGASARRLDVDGVADFNHRGISYGAPQYHASGQWVKQKVGILGGGNSAGQAALYLSKCEDCEVHVFVRGEDLENDMSRYLVDRFRKANIIVHARSNLKRVSGVDKLEVVCFERDGIEQEFRLDHLLIQIGAEPQTGWLEGTLDLDRKGYILTDRDITAGRWPITDRAPFRFETSLPGVFAGGDAHANTPNRMSCAVGEGHALGVSVHKYLMLMHEREVQLHAVQTAA